MNLSDAGISLEDFSRRRGWAVHHLPRSVLLALVREVGEAAELLQWVPDDQVDAWLDAENHRETFAAELADVFIYLQYLARSTGVDLEDAVIRKIKVNEQRFPEQTGPSYALGDRTTGS